MEFIHVFFVFTEQSSSNFILICVTSSTLLSLQFISGVSDLKGIMLPALHVAVFCLKLGHRVEFSNC